MLCGEVRVDTRWLMPSVSVFLNSDGRVSI